MDKTAGRLKQENHEHPRGTKSTIKWISRGALKTRLTSTRVAQTLAGGTSWNILTLVLVLQDVADEFDPGTGKRRQRRLPELVHGGVKWDLSPA